MKNNHLLLFLVLFFLSCQKEKIQLVPSEFEPYVDEFFHQAQLRGYDIYKKDFDFSITLEDIEDPTADGLCYFDGNRIVIDEPSWIRKNEQEKEFIIFHELGHCLLDRNHRKVKTTNNECYSYMRGRDRDIDEDDFSCSLNLYSKEWKKYYLDELFDQSTSFPFWYYENRDYPEPNSSANYLLEWKDTLVESFEINDIDFQSIENFLVEIDFDIINSPSNSFRFYLGKIKFGGCPKCIASSLEIQKDNKEWYASEWLENNSKYKLSIVRRGKFASFFLNKKYYHTIEFDAFEGNGFNFSSFRDQIENVSVKVISY